MSDRVDGNDRRRLPSIPVIVLGGAALGPVAEAGARRAGQGARIVRVTPAGDVAPALWGATAGGAEIVIVDAGGREELRIAGHLGARPLAALPLEHADAIEAFLPADVDVHVPLPTPDEAIRARVLAIVASFGLEAIHHLVEVDPRPAFAELGVDAGAVDLDRLAAGAAGVLAGRLAAGNRRWRDALAD
jgi:hypothetical protein